MPQLTADQLRNKILSNASQETQDLYGYKPEAKTTKVPTGPEKDAPVIATSNFDLVTSDNTRKRLKDLDAGNEGIQDRYHFSFETTLKNAFDGVYDNAVTSKDKEISSAWKAFKDTSVKYIEDLAKAEKGRLTEEQIRALESTHNDILNLWNSAQNSLNVYYDTTAEETKARTGDNKILYYSPVVDSIVDKLTFERKESPIYQGDFFSNVPYYVAKHNPTATELKVTAASKKLKTLGGPLGGIGSTISWLWGVDPDDLKLREEKSKIAGYNDAYSMIWQTDPNTEQAAKALTQTYFERASYMTTNDNAKKHFITRRGEAGYVNHNQMLEENVGHLLNMMSQGGDEEASNLEISFKTALKPGNKDGFKKWMSGNRRSLLGLTKRMTPVQNVRMYYHYGDVGTKGGTAIFSNPQYFDKDRKAGQDKLTGWKNVIDPYIKEQNAIRKQLYKINRSVVNKMQTKRNPDYMQNRSSGYGGDYQEAVFLRYMFTDKGVKRTQAQMNAAIDAEARRLSEKFPVYGEDPGYEDRFMKIMTSPETMDDLGRADNSQYANMVREQAMLQAGGGNIRKWERESLIKKGVPQPTDAEARFLDWYYRPRITGNYSTSNRSLSGKSWVNGSGEARESYNKLTREFKIKFGEESVSETFQYTMMRDSFGKAGAHSAEYRRINRNDSNAIKTKHFNTILSIAEKSFENDATSGKVYIKDGALDHTDRPDMYTGTNRQERASQLKNFLKDDKAEYKLAYINQTADRNKVAYMISKYDKNGNFSDNITLFMDKSYAKNNNEIFAQSVFNDLSDERYRLEGSYNLSALDDKRIATNLRLESEDGAMWLMGDKKGKEEGEEMKIFMGSNQYTTVDDAIEKIRFNFSEYKKRLDAQQ